MQSWIGRNVSLRLSRKRSSPGGEDRSNGYTTSSDFYSYTDVEVVAMADLSNTDKHRVLHVVNQGLQLGRETMIQPAIEQDVADVLKVHALLIGSHLNDGAVLVCAEIVPGGPEPKMYFDALFPCQLVLEGGMPLLLVLTAIHESVMNIVQWFRPVFEGKPAGERPDMRRFA